VKPAQKHTVTVPHSLWVKTNGSPMRIRELIQIGLDAEEERMARENGPTGPSLDLTALDWTTRWQTLDYPATCSVGHHGMPKGSEYQWATLGFDEESGRRLYARRCREHA
jgi:hypothetical protein